MGQLKMRLFGLVLIALGGGLTYYNWYTLRQTSEYSVKIATFGPVIVVGGIFLFLFPSIGGKPETTRQKLLALGVLLVGLAAGAVNFYLMDPGFFRP